MIKHRIARVATVLGLSLGTVIAVNSPAMASGSFESLQTTMIIRDNGTWVGTVEVAVWTMSQPRGRVQARVFAGNFNGWTKPEAVGKLTTYRGWVTLNRNLPDGSKICAEGFLDGHSVGMPCATIKR